MVKGLASISRQSRLILLGAAILLTVGMGIRQSFGLFLTPVTKDLSLTASDFTLAIAVQNIVWGLAQAFVAAIADRYGLRRTMVAGALMYVAGLSVMAGAKGAPALFVSGGMIGIALACTATSLSMSACARAVTPAQRSMTLGVVAAIGALGTLVGPLATQAILGHHAWQIGILFFTVLALALVPAAFLAGGADKIPQTGATHRTSMTEVLDQALRNRQFLVMSGAYFVCGLNLMFLTTHIPAYLALCGQDPMLSAWTLAVIGGVSAIGSLITGWLGGLYPKHIILGAVYVLRSIMIAAYFALPPTPVSTILFAVAMGLLWWPGLAPLTGGIIADVFGTRYMATLLGMSFVVHQVGSSLGTWGGGLIFDLTGSYDPAWKIGVTIGLAAGLVQMVFGGPPRAGARKPGMPAATPASAPAQGAT
ncbi:MAG: MFS transporter [Hyphomicrobiales bacterium]|nr:MFS transporter [Hyphomicrobiales bacterium]